jgi:hypothetical protein
MISTVFSKPLLRSLLGVGILCAAVSLPLPAQVQTQRSEKQLGQSREVTVERGEIAYIAGRTVIVKMEDGSLREFDNVPDSATFMVDGKPVNIHNAQVGMKLEKQTVRTTTDNVITTVETVTGKVFHVSPPKSVILTLENGQNQVFTIPEGQKFMINGQETDVWGLRKGMKISAQRVTEVPHSVIAEEVTRTAVAPPPPAPKQDVPILIVVARHAPPPAPTETAKEEAPARLPTTATNLPLLGLLGVLFCGLSLIVTVVRKVN